MTRGNEARMIEWSDGQWPDDENEDDEQEEAMMSAKSAELRKAHHTTWADDVDRVMKADRISRSAAIDKVQRERPELLAMAKRASAAEVLH